MEAQSPEIGSNGSASRRQRVLFVAENLTLAQVVRLVTLANAMDTSVYELHFACSEFDPMVFSRTKFERWQIHSVEKHNALERVSRGERIYDERTLRQYVDEELALMERVQPTVVVGDFRLSLSVSCPLRRVPLATLVNAYWSPYAVRERFPVPDHPIVKLVGVERAQKFFPQAMPLAFKHFAAPVNSLRKRYGLSPLGSLLEVLTYGNCTLYPDIPELCPTSNLPSSHEYLGHVPWAPDLPEDELLRQLNPERPLVYVTLGSSGNLDAMKAVLGALAQLPVTALLSTAARLAPEQLPPNVFARDFVAGDRAARVASLVITNGGSSTGYQALAEGTPVLGLPSNLDQYLAMAAIEAKGAGKAIRSATANVSEVRSGIEAVLSNPSYRLAAQSVARSFEAYDYRKRFNAAIEGLIEGRNEWKNSEDQSVYAP